MRAAVQVGYGDLESSVRLGEMPMPEPGAGEVVVRVGGTTVNRKDLFALANLTGPGIRQRPPLPHINGTDAWGTVVAAGADVRDWREGHTSARLSGPLLRTLRVVPAWRNVRVPLVRRHRRAVLGQPRGLRARAGAESRSLSPRD